MATPEGGATPILAVEDIDFSYGQLQILFGVSLHLDHGEALALLGTTLTSYVYVWQTIEESEEKAPPSWARAKEEGAVLGVLFGVVIFWFILICTAATLGVIGFEQRWEYAAIGNVPNLAARLCGEARAGEIILDAQTEREVAHIAEIEPIGPLSLRGFQQPVPAFKLKSIPD